MQPKTRRPRTLVVLGATVAVLVLVVPMAAAEGPGTGLLQRVLGLESSVEATDDEVAALQEDVDALQGEVEALRTSLQGEVNALRAALEEVQADVAAGTGAPRLVALRSGRLGFGLTVVQATAADGTPRPGTYEVTLDGRETDDLACYAIQVLPTGNNDKVNLRYDAEYIGTAPGDVLIFDYTLQVQQRQYELDSVTGVGRVWRTAEEAIEDSADPTNAIGYFLGGNTIFTETPSSLGDFAVYVWETEGTAACLG